MEKLKIIECHGFSREEAFKDLNFDQACAAIRGNNATQAWEKYGKPIPGTQEFKRFASQQLMEKTKWVPGLGLHIVITQPIKDTRKRPYTIINMLRSGTREWTLMYQIREDDIIIDSLPEKNIDYDGNLIDGESIPDIHVIKIGPVVAEYDNKTRAVAEAKRLTAIRHKNYSIVPIKVPSLTPISAYSIYTPSCDTTEGVFIAFGLDKE